MSTPMACEADHFADAPKMVEVLERRMRRSEERFIIARADGRPVAPMLRRVASLGRAWRAMRELEGGAR